MKKIILTVVVIALTIGFAPPAQASTSITKLIVSANCANERLHKGLKAGTVSGTFILNTTSNTISPRT